MWKKVMLLVFILSIGILLNACVYLRSDSVPKEDVDLPAGESFSEGKSEPIEEESFQEKRGTDDWERRVERLSKIIDETKLALDTNKIVIRPEIKIFHVDPDVRNGINAQTSVVRVRFSGVVFFESGEDKLRKDSESVLGVVTKYILEDKPDTKVLLLGHTDSRGTMKFNEKLSMKRALSVLEDLRERGVKKEQLSAIPIGEMQPIDDNDTEEGRAQNRRVEFLFSPSEEANRKVVIEGEYRKKKTKERSGVQKLSSIEVKEKIASLDVVRLPDLIKKDVIESSIEDVEVEKVIEINTPVVRRVIKSRLTKRAVIEDY